MKMTMTDFIERVEIGLAKHKRWNMNTKDLVLCVDRQTYKNLLEEFLNLPAIKRLNADIKTEVPKIMGLPVYIVDTDKTVIVVGENSF